MSSEHQRHSVCSYRSFLVAKQITDYPSSWKLQEMKDNSIFFGSTPTGLSTNAACLWTLEMLRRRVPRARLMLHTDQDYNNKVNYQTSCFCFTPPNWKLLGLSKKSSKYLQEFRTHFSLLMDRCWFKWRSIKRILWKHIMDIFSI